MKRFVDHNAPLFQWAMDNLNQEFKLSFPESILLINRCIACGIILNPDLSVFEEYSEETASNYLRTRYTEAMDKLREDRRFFFQTTWKDREDIKNWQSLPSSFQVKSRDYVELPRLYLGNPLTSFPVSLLGGNEEESTMLSVENYKKSLLDS